MSCRVDELSELLARARTCLEEKSRALRTSFRGGEAIPPSERAEAVEVRLEEAKDVENKLRGMLELLVDAVEIAEVGLARFRKAHPNLDTNSQN